MALKSTYPVTAKAPGIVFIAGHFVANGGDAPTLVGGAGFTVGAPTDGVYTITLTDGPVPEALCVLASVVDPNADSTVRVRPGFADGSDGTFRLITQSAEGVDANLTNVVVSFFVVVRNTGAKR